VSSSCRADLGGEGLVDADQPRRRWHDVNVGNTGLARKVAKVDVVGEDVEQPTVATTEPRPRRGRGLGVRSTSRAPYPCSPDAAAKLTAVSWLLTAMVRKANFKTNVLSGTPCDREQPNPSR
jgi:hypothetical protein